VKKVIKMMSCEQFELLGLDMDRPDAQPEEAAAAAEHAASCTRCFALLESWRELKQDLRLLRENSCFESAPARVEMRLKLELRTRREARVPRSAVTAARWALAAAAVLVAGLGWNHWRGASSNNAANQAPAASSNSQSATAGSDRAMLLAADSDSGAFTRLPASMPSAYENQEILQVRMQRGALGRFGLPVAQDRAAEWVQVDFLIGEDGVPQAVRLHDDSQLESTLQ
jgi:anti-sigma factor RsiW